MRDWGRVWFCCLEDHLPTLGCFGRISACTGPAKTALFLRLLAPGFSIPLQDSRGTSSRACGSGVAWWGCHSEDEAPLGWGKVCTAAFVPSWPCPPCLFLTKGAELLRPSVCRPFPQMAPLCAVKLLPFPGLFFWGKCMKLIVQSLGLCVQLPALAGETVPLNTRGVRHLWGRLPFKLSLIFTSVKKLVYLMCIS